MHVLTPANIDAALTSGSSTGMWFLDFHAPWCGHCKQLAPQFAHAATKLAGRVQFGSVDASEYRSLAMRFGISGFPTLFLVNGTSGDVYRSQVSHNADAITHYLQRGWKASAATAPLTGLASPQHPVKLAIFRFMQFAESVVALHVPLAERLGVPSIVLLFAVMMLTVMATAGLLIALAVFIGRGTRATASQRARVHVHSD